MGRWAVYYCVLVVTLNWYGGFNNKTLFTPSKLNNLILQKFSWYRKREGASHNLDSILSFRVLPYKQPLVGIGANCATKTSSTGCNFFQNKWPYSAHNPESHGKFEQFQKENHSLEHQVLGFSFSFVWESAQTSPLFPLALLCTVLPQILPSYPTPLSCQQLPTFLLV